MEEEKTAWNSGSNERWRLTWERKLNEWKTIPLNVAVIGYSGVGKSSFINAIRRLTPDDKGAADVGFMRDTRVDIKSYSHPNNPLLMFWDLPGVGTEFFPRRTYLYDINIDRYDFFLLLSAGRFTENDIWLCNEFRIRNKQYFFVRTKVGIDISNNKKAHPRTHNEDAVVRMIRESTEEHLRENGCDHVPVFLIDSYKPTKFDFNQLEYDIIEKVSHLKKTALVLSLQATYGKMIQLKMKELRSRMWKAAALAGAVGLIPLPGVSVSLDIAVVSHEGWFYYTQLGLDEISLKRYAKFTSINDRELQHIVKQCLGLQVSGVEGFRGLVVELLKGAGPFVSCAAVAEGVKFLPGVGSLIAAPLYFAGTQYALNHVLVKMESAALEVIQFAAINADDED